MPIYEMRRALEWILKGAARLPGMAKRTPVVNHIDGRPPANIQHGFHALAIDDRRFAFWPTLWTKTGNDAFDARFEQVWFAGMHADVGGGYPKHSLSLVSLNWMLNRLETLGLRFLASDREHYRQHANALGTMNDSRGGVGMYYRYNPRDIPMLWQEANEKAKDPPPLAVHESVLARIQDKAQDYAPYNLPAQFEVVGDDGRRHSWPSDANAYDADPKRAASAGARNDHADGPGCLVCNRRLLYLIFVATTLAFLIVLLGLNPAPEDYTAVPGETSWLLDKFGSVRDGLGWLFGILLPDALRDKFAVLTDFKYPFWTFVILSLLLWAWHVRLKGKSDRLSQKIWNHAFHGSQLPEGRGGKAIRWSRSAGSRCIFSPCSCYSASALCSRYGGSM